MVQVPGEPVAPGLSRRTFLATTGGPGWRCGVWTGQPGHRRDRPAPTGWDAAFCHTRRCCRARPARNTIYLVSTLLAATTQGLIDLDGNRSRPWRGHGMGRHPRFTDLYLSAAPGRALPQWP